MMKDPIVEQYRQVGNAYTESFNHDLDAIVEDLRRRQEAHRDRLVSFAKETSEAPTRSNEPTLSFDEVVKDLRRRDRI